MADISKDDLRKEVTAILKDADLSSMSAKKVRQQLEKKLDVDLSSRKKELDDLVLECLKDKKDKKGKDSKKKKKDDDDEDDEDAEEDEEEEEEAEEDEEEDEDEDEDEKPKAKRGSSSKKPVAKRPKKGSSEESDEGSEENVSDEEYSPKKGKAAVKKGKAGGKKKKKGSDSDSDEDWARSRNSRSGGGGGGGGGGSAKKGGGKKGGGGGGGYTKPHALSAELAAVVGQDTMARHEVVKKIWAIIKEKNLYDPKNRQFAICDEPMQKVIGQKRFRIFGMMKYLKNHFVD